MHKTLPMSQIRVVFDNIQHQIGKEIQGSTHSIRIATNWLTDQDLYDLLCNKANEGLRVELLLLKDDINNNRLNIDVELLRQSGAEVLLVNLGNGMYSKFCISDTATVINGSYNRELQAQQNDEYIVIVGDDPDFVAGYIDCFNRLKQKYRGKVTGKSPDLASLSKRLEMLRNAIALFDTDDELQQRKKIAQLFIEQPKEWLSIENCLNRNDLEEAVLLINNWLQNLIALSVFEDPEVEELQFELKVIEIQMKALRDEKTEMETLISAFNRRYHAELSSLILKLLELEAETAEQAAEQAPNDEAKQSAYEELKNRFKEFFNQYHTEKEKQKKTSVLTPEDEKLLRTLYRKASRLCYPDLIQDKELHDEAERIFKELNNANEAKDIARVREILDLLENGKPFTPSDNSKLKKEQLRTRVSHLKQSLYNLLQEIDQFNSSETYKTIIAIGNDWDAYFNNAKTQLQNKIDNLNITKAG